jgi:hypothetical protein
MSVHCLKTTPRMTKEVHKSSLNQGPDRLTRNLAMKHITPKISVLLCNLLEDDIYLVLLKVVENHTILSK